MSDDRKERFNANDLLSKMQFYALKNGFVIKKIEVSKKEFKKIPDFIATYGDNSVEVEKVS